MKVKNTINEHGMDEISAVLMLDRSSSFYVLMLEIILDILQYLFKRLLQPIQRPIFNESSNFHKILMEQHRRPI